MANSVDNMTAPLPLWNAKSISRPTPSRSLLRSSHPNCEPHPFLLTRASFSHSRASLFPHSSSIAFIQRRLSEFRYVIAIFSGGLIISSSSPGASPLYSTKCVWLEDMWLEEAGNQHQILTATTNALLDEGTLQIARCPHWPSLRAIRVRRSCELFIEFLRHGVEVCGCTGSSLLSIVLYVSLDVVDDEVAKAVNFVR